MRAYGGGRGAAGDGASASPARAAAARDPRAILLDSPMSAFQWAAVLTTFLLSAMDGFDVLAISLVAPSLTHQWHINPAALGLVFSVGLVGMAAGSFLVAPIGDVLGRRVTMFGVLTVVTVGTLMSARSADVGTLALWRFLTGVGLGAVIALINPLAAEYANLKRREIAISLMAIGFPLGGVFGGLAASYLLPHEGWRAVFLLAGGCGVVLLGLVAVLLPEPIAFLIERQGPGALERVNRFLRRCGHPTVDRLPERTISKTRARPLEIFHASHLRDTVHMSAILLLFVVTVYFFLNWIPQMVHAAGFAPAVAARVSVVANVCGAVGGALLGWAAGRFSLKTLAFCAVLGMGLGAMAFGFSGASLPFLMLTAAVAGFSAHSGMVSMHSLIARTFPSHMRATGAGFTLGVSRIGSAFAPAAAGYLFNAGLPRSSVSLVMGTSGAGSPRGCCCSSTSAAAWGPSPRRPSTAWPPSCRSSEAGRPEAGAGSASGGGGERGPQTSVRARRPAWRARGRCEPPPPWRSGPARLRPRRATGPPGR